MVMAFSAVFFRNFFRVFCLMLAGLVAVGAVAACGSEPEPEPAEVVSETPVAAPGAGAPTRAAPQPATDNVPAGQPATPVPLRPAGPTATTIVVAPAPAQPMAAPPAPQASDAARGTEQTGETVSPPAASGFSYKDIGPNTTWGDVFNSFSDGEQACIRSEFGAVPIEPLLEMPFNLEAMTPLAAKTVVDCVSEESAAQIALAETSRQLGGITEGEAACLQELYTEIPVSELTKAETGEPTTEAAMLKMSYALGLLNCLPKLAEEAFSAATQEGGDGGYFNADPSQLWSFPTGGWVLTAPAVAEGRVYAGSDDGNLYALSADKGELQWSFATGDVIRSTPTVADRKVFFGSNDNHLYALDTETGEEQWRYNTGEWVQYSPTVGNGMVYFAAPSGGDRKVHAVDAATGQVAWIAEQPFPIGAQHTPTVIGDKVYAQGAEYGQFYALNAATGETMWQAEVGGYVESAPTVEGGVVYLTVANRAYAFNEGTGEVIWEVNTEEFPARDFPALLVDGVCYLAPSDTVYALDAATGNELWSYDAANLSTAPVVAGEVFYGASDLAEYIFALDVATGEELWTLTTEDFQSYSLSVVDGRLYGQLTEGNLFALNAADGEDLWYFDAGGFSDVRIYTVADGVIYSGGPNNSVYAHRAP